MKNNSQEIINRLSKYLSGASCIQHMPIAEAMVMCKGKTSEEESSQKFIPFLSEVKIGPPEMFSMSVELEEGATSPPSLSSSPPATAPIMIKASEAQTPPSSPNISAMSPSGSIGFKMGILLLLVMVFVSVTGRQMDCGNRWCRCDTRLKKATCKDHGRNLTFIPHLPNYVTKLNFSSNFLAHISTRTFGNISSLHLMEMNITYNSIQTITPDAFSDLFHLKHLSLNGNRVSSNILVELFPCFANLSLSILSLEKMEITNTLLFRQYHSQSLQTLILDRNRLAVYNQSHFEYLHQLQKLSLGHNYIKTVSLALSLSLQNLNLKDNIISLLPNFCSSNGRQNFFPNLKVLKLDHNSLLSIDAPNIKCLKKLSLLSFNANRILRLTRNTFSELSSLKNLILRSVNGIREIEKYAFNNSYIQYISMTSGGIIFKTHVHKDAFRGCSSIRSLDVSNNNFHRAVEEDLDAWFGHLASLSGLGLGKCGITHYPEFIPLKLREMKYLKLYGNSMKEIPVGAFTPLTKLTHLWLTNNDIAKVEEKAFPPEVRDRIQEISLMYNPFACDCDILWFLNWTRSESKKFQNYPKRYECNSPGRMQGKTLSKVDLTVYTCLLPFTVSLIITGCSGIFLLMLLIVSLTYRWRWHIRYYVYLRAKKREAIRQVAPNDIVYDAYVIYSLGDITWIKNELIPNLEDASGKKLYIRDRDSLAGLPIVDNVVDNMAVSRSTLVVLSNTMARDEQCQFELMFVQRQEEGHRSPIILVLLEEVQAANVNQSVYALIKMHSYISWSHELNAKELFWNGLQQSLNAGLDIE